MKRTVLFLGVVVLFSCKNEKANTAQNADNNSGSTEWKSLLSGNSIDQWRAYGKDTMPTDGWVVDDGDLVIKKAPKPRPEGFGGDIITKEKFGNFDLRLDFMVTDTANSGIFYFVIEEEGSPMWFNAPEYQILDDKTYVEMMTILPISPHSTGSNYDLQAAPTRLVKPVGEWNSARILHKNGHVEHWLNGHMTCKYQVGSPAWEAMVRGSKFKDFKGYGRAKKGHIGLQDHDYEVKFRNIRIREL